jgi:ABC-type thiamine transport system ATPase subunit
MCQQPCFDTKQSLALNTNSNYRLQEPNKTSNDEIKSISSINGLLNRLPVELKGGADVGRVTFSLEQV